MNSRLILALIVVLVAALIYYQQTVEKPSGRGESPSAEGIRPTDLSGLPQQLDASLHHAQEGGVEALGAWLATYGAQVQDPRKAWIQLDYCTLLARENPQKAREIYREVRQRVGKDSPVYARVKDLERSLN